MSWQAAVLVILLFSVYMLFRKIQPVFHYYLWGLLLVRLIIPFNIPVPFGLTHSFRTVGEIEMKEISQKIPVPEKNIGIGTAQMPVISLNNGIKMFKSDPMETSAYLWLAGILFFGIGSIGWNIYMKKVVSLLYKTDRKDIKDFVKLKCRELDITKKVEVLCMTVKMPYGPTIIGIRNPKILLPFIVLETWRIEDIEPVIVHELIHIKRHDFFANILQIIIQIIFFFNPFVWFANWKVRELREQICDDLSIKYLSNNRKHYSASFVNMIEYVFECPIWFFANLGFSERRSSLARRIARINNMKYINHKPLTIFSNISMVAIAVLTFSLACDHSPESIMGGGDDRILKSGDVNAMKINQDVTKEETENFIIVKISEFGDYQIDDYPADLSNFLNILQDVKTNTNKERLLIIPSHLTPSKYIGKVIEFSKISKINFISVKKF